MTCFAEFAYVSRILVCLKLNCAENLLGNNLRFAREYFILLAFQGHTYLVARNTHATQKNDLNRGFCRETVVVRFSTAYSAPRKSNFCVLLIENVKTMHSLLFCNANLGTSIASLVSH